MKSSNLFLGLCCVYAAGCAGEISEPLTTSSSALFMRVDKPLGLKLDIPSELEQPVSDRDFYLAVRKDVLGSGDKFFLSAYMKQLTDDTAFDVGAYSLGTRVVSIEAQNGNIIVFDVDNTRKTTDSFEPTVILDAFPIVANYEKFNNRPGSDNYVLFDPAGGQNEFALFGQATRIPFDQNTPSQAVEIQVAFLQDFKRLADGVSFEKVFAGSAIDKDHNLREVYGTLGIAIREYRESDDFQEVLMPGVSHFFGALPRAIEASGPFDPSEETPVGKWHIHEGMDPIQWVISPAVLEMQNDPLLEGVDLLAAFKAGIENWNSVFGYEVLTARVAETDESFADDSVNYLVIDDAGFLGAFADWRINPNTGEIRGASVLFSSKLPNLAATMIYPSEDDLGPGFPFATEPTEAPVAYTQRPQLHWMPMPGAVLCDYKWDAELRSLTGLEEETPDEDAPEAGSDELTRQQKIEKFITHIVLHEIGHTLGLRHNFKGSMMPGSSSVMDYLDDNHETLDRVTPGSYDIAAIKWLYGMSDELPTEPFCTDEHMWGDAAKFIGGDADCNARDRFADPLNEFHGPAYQEQVEAVLSGNLPEFFWEAIGGWFSVEVLRYAWFNHELANRALEISLQGVGVPVDESLLVDQPDYGRRADIVARVALRELFNSFLKDLAPEFFGTIGLAPPQANPEFTTALMFQISGVLTNADNIRSFDSRRLMVDLLKQHQSNDAMNVLYRAQVSIEEELAANPDSNDLKELANQLNAALDPYFN